MNILQLTDYLPDYAGNFGNSLIAITQRAYKKNYKCFISFPEPRKWHDIIKNSGGSIFYLQVHKFNEKKIDVTSILILKKLITKQKINLVHVHFGLSQKVITLFLKIMNPKIKIVWHWRGDIDDNLSNAKKIQAFFFYRIIADFFVNAHIANSNNIFNRLKEKRLVNMHKLYTLPNAVIIDKFIKNNYFEKIQTIRNKYDTNNYFTLIMIRNFRKRVSFDIIIDSMEYLQKLSNEFQLLWIGYGETETKIKSLVKSRGIKNIKFIGKVNNPIPFYFASKINLIAWEPWCKETINNTAYEALMSNIPVLGLNFGSLPITFNEEEGVFTVPLNYKEYSKKIIFIKDHYSSLKLKLFNGKQKIIKSYSIEIYLDKLFEIYNKC